ncbi:hypothetical protein HDU96_003004 [Phlyctochytrium bullatum]|nr:hypothetical protein HDU96_003004 [Phlyctochytrium bullatum]
MAVIQKFHSGEINTVVATCIGEEGLDIGEVDLIICFDAQNSPIRMLQRMGRTGRKRAGRVVMLLAEGKEEESYRKAQAQYKAIQKAIANDRFKLHGEDMGNLLPKGVAPKCVKKEFIIPSVPAAPAAGSKALPAGKNQKEKSGDKVKGARKIVPEKIGFLTVEQHTELKTKFGILPDSRFIDIPLQRSAHWQVVSFPTAHVAQSQRSQDLIQLMQLFHSLAEDEEERRPDFFAQDVISKHLSVSEKEHVDRFIEELFPRVSRKESRKRKGSNDDDEVFAEHESEPRDFEYSHKKKRPLRALNDISLRLSDDEELEDVMKLLFEEGKPGKPDEYRAITEESDGPADDDKTLHDAVSTTLKSPETLLFKMNCDVAEGHRETNLELMDEEEEDAEFREKPLWLDLDSPKEISKTKDIIKTVPSKELGDLSKVSKALAFDSSPRRPDRSPGDLSRISGSPYSLDEVSLDSDDLHLLNDTVLLTRPQFSLQKFGENCARFKEIDEKSPRTKVHMELDQEEFVQPRMPEKVERRDEKTRSPYLPVEKQAGGNSFPLKEHPLLTFKEASEPSSKNDADAPKDTRAIQEELLSGETQDEPVVTFKNPLQESRQSKRTGLNINDFLDVEAEVESNTDDSGDEIIDGDIDCDLSGFVVKDGEGVSASSTPGTGLNASNVNSSSPEISRYQRALLKAQMEKLNASLRFNRRPRAEREEWEGEQTQWGEGAEATEYYDDEDLADFVVDDESAAMTSSKPVSGSASPFTSSGIIPPSAVASEAVEDLLDNIDWDDVSNR